MPPTKRLGAKTFLRWFVNRSRATVIMLPVAPAYPRERIMKFSLQLIFFLIVSVINAPVYAQERQPFVFATSDSATPVVNAYHQFLQRVYAEIGYAIELRRYPVKRSYIQADFDKIDGILISTDSLSKDFPNLVAVPVPLTQVDLVVFSIAEDFVVDGPDSLKDYKIGLLRGYLASEAMTRSMHRQIVDDYKSLFTILQMGRVDVVIALRRETERFLAANPVFGPVKALDPPLLSIPMYHFLNRRHAHLIPQLIPVMQRLIDEKVLEKLYEPYRVE